MHKRLLQSFNNIRIAKKYILALAISVCLFICATVIVLFQLQEATKNVNSIIDHANLERDMAQLALTIEKQSSVISNFIIIGGSNYVEEYEKNDEALNKISERLAVHFEEDENNKMLYARIVDNNQKISNIFLNNIVADQFNEDGTTFAQIEISSLKNSSVALVNKMTEEINENKASLVNTTKASMHHSRILLLVSNIASVIIGILAMVGISLYISRHLRHVVHATNTIAEGDLRLDILPYKGKDEIGQLTNAVNHLKNNLTSIVQSVATSAHTVANHSELVTTTSNSMKEGTAQMAATMEELAQGAEVQANDATQLTTKMTNFVQAIHQSQTEGEKIAKSSETILSLTEDGRRHMDQSIKQMGVIDEIVHESVNRVRGLDEQTKQISSLVGIVQDIAAQTNLLALNAAIEAARAGEHGRGFAVVADEVRLLAEQVSSSVSEITGIAGNIQVESSDVVHDLDRGYEEVQDGIKQIAHTGKSFDMIQTSITEMTDRILSIAKSLKDISDNSEEVNELIEDIAAVSEEAAAGIQQSTASTQEAASTMDEISHFTSELFTLSQALQDHIAAFRTEVAEGEEEPKEIHNEEEGQNYTVDPLEHVEEIGLEEAEEITEIKRDDTIIHY